jgi:hypothetical protein
MKTSKSFEMAQSDGHLTIIIMTFAKYEREINPHDFYLAIWT